MSEAYAWLGRGKCGHVVMLLADDGHPFTDDVIASVVRNGGSVERLAVDEARTSLQWCRCNPEPKKRKAKRAAEGGVG